MKNFLILIPIFFPQIAALIMGIIKFKSDKNRNIYISTVVMLNLFFIIGILISNNLREIHLIKINSFLDIYFKIDRLGILFVLLASILWIFTTFYSFVYMTHEGNEKRFFIYFMLTLGVTVGIAFSGNLFTLYLYYEFLTLATFPLVIHSGSKEALRVGKKYLIYSFSGATLALLGIILIFSISNNLNFVENGVLQNISIDNPKLLLTIYMVMFIGFGVKAALVPLHSWLPAAMVAPTPVSSLLHAVAVVKSGIFALIRISYFIFGSDVLKKIHGNYYISILVILTILMGSLLALHQDNLKKRLAYSTVSQLGYILLGIVLLNQNSLTGSLLHLVNHAVIKITLFFCVGAIYFKTGKKYIHEIRGIGKEMPITMWCFTISSISLIGIPPTNGFVSKWYLALGGLGENKAVFVIILLLSALLTAGYLLPIVITAFFPGEEKNIVKKEPDLSMLIPIVLLTIIVVFLGLFPNVVLHFIQSIVRNIV
ncbi:multisubunit sodium/proton antiporter, MrpD subunit [Caminicella sporogenes DSM 14501]|uniref:Multisubunit sodium/proton antiporter, MrpD subunit n=1 Tax=Caminicella sporogenes DSM 14501 TaxID=1121266 RepID=A0A1M6NEG4_9FIRM|nr:monovalent cation/H+ antiporter subunit D family protein [Caminicella sporogenes]SHJ94004.1 multisubunit sodium/proton antiporter, MrpD subunit [Caminicella sporogenes DSM 14501]